MADVAMPKNAPPPAPAAVEPGAPLSADSAIFGQLLDASPDGVVVCDVQVNDAPAVYANRTFEQLTGYRAADIVGRNMRFLHGDDRDQEGLSRIRLALKEGVATQAVVRNYRKDGTLFWNEIKLAPIRNATGKVTHFASFHRDAGERPKADVRTDQRTEPRDPSLNTQTMLAYLRDDKLTGLLRRGYFDELLKRDIGIAQRESRSLSLFLFDPDFFEPYRELFGRAGADQSLRRIGRTIGASFRRASDLCARFDDTRIAALCTGMEPDQAAAYAETILARIRDLAIHHPRSSVSRFMTMSAGIVTLVPTRDADSEKLIAAAQDALQRARAEGRNCVIGVSA